MNRVCFVLKVVFFLLLSPPKMLCCKTSMFVSYAVFQTTSHVKTSNFCPQSVQGARCKVNKWSWLTKTKLCLSHFKPSAVQPPRTINGTENTFYSPLILGHFRVLHSELVSGMSLNLHYRVQQYLVERTD